MKLKDFKRKLIAILILSIAFIIGMQAQEDTCRPLLCFNDNKSQPQNLDLYQNYTQLAHIREALVKWAGISSDYPDSCRMLSCWDFQNLDFKQQYNELVKIRDLIKYLSTHGGSGSDTSKVPLAGTANKRPQTGTIKFVPPFDGAPVIADSSVNGMGIGWYSSYPANTATATANVYYGAPFGNNNPRLYSTIVSGTFTNTIYSNASSTRLQSITPTTNSNLLVSNVGLQFYSPLFNVIGTGNYKGITYGATTCNSINANYDSTSVLHKGENDRLYVRDSTFFSGAYPYFTSTGKLTADSTLWVTSPGQIAIGGNDTRNNGGLLIFGNSNAPNLMGKGINLDTIYSINDFALTAPDGGGFILPATKNIFVLTDGAHTADTAAFLDIPPSRKDIAHINLKQGTTPTVLKDGDFWHDASGFNIRVGSTTTTLGGGTVSTFSAINSSGINFSVSNASTTPTLSVTSVTGILATAASANLTSKTTATTTVVSFANGASAASYKVGGYLTVNSVTTDVINMRIVWTDENSNVQTFNYSNISTIGYNNLAELNIRVKASTTITVSTILTTSSGSINYDVGASIMQIK